MKGKKTKVTRKNAIKGFKAFEVCSDNKTLHCRQLLYELGKARGQTLQPKLCVRGFHFCTNIVDVLRFYTGSYGKWTPNDTPIRIGRVRAWGTVDKSDQKCASNNIIIDKLLTLEEVLKELKHNIQQTVECDIRWLSGYDYDYKRMCEMGRVAFVDMPEELKWNISYPGNFDFLLNKKIRMKDFKGKDVMKVKITFIQRYHSKSKGLTRDIRPTIVSIKPIK